MSCVFCEFYKGLNKHCMRNVYVENLYESFDCPDYEYNGTVSVIE